MTDLKKYKKQLDKKRANHVPLSPLSLARRTAEVFPDHVAVIHGEERRTWGETYERCRRLASALKDRGVQRGDTVAVMAPNVPALLESHFGVPLCGAVLNAEDIHSDPHLRERGMIMTMHHPSQGSFDLPGFPVQLKDSPVEMKPAPLLGEHNAEVFAELLGLNEHDLMELKREAVI